MATLEITKDELSFSALMYHLFEIQEKLASDASYSRMMDDKKYGRPTGHTLILAELAKAHYDGIIAMLNTHGYADMEQYKADVVFHG